MITKSHWLAIITIGALVGMGWSANSVSEGKADKGDVDNLRDKIHAMQVTHAGESEIQRNILDLLKDLKNDLGKTNDKIDQVGRDQTLTLREVIKAREALNYQPPASVMPTNPMNR
jgi:hypothetical protein